MFTPAQKKLIAKLATTPCVWLIGKHAYISKNRTSSCLVANRNTVDALIRMGTLVKSSDDGKECYKLAV